MKASVMVFCALSLSACVENLGKSAAEGFSKGFNEAMSRDALTGNTYDKGGSMRFGAVDPDYPRAGVTYATSDYSHGLQLEHFAADGRAHLWYPGNTRTVTGEWKAKGNELCFRYQTNSYNPVTGQKGGKWECGSRHQSARSVVSQVAGDPFGLKSGKVPAHDLRGCKLPGDMKLMTQMRCFPKG